MTPRVKPPHTLVSVLHWLWYCRATALSALANLTLSLGKNMLPFPTFGNLNFVSPPHRRAYTSIPKSCPNIRFPHQQDFFPISSVTKSLTARFSHENLVEKFKIFVQDFAPIRTALTTPIWGICEATTAPLLHINQIISTGWDCTSCTYLRIECTFYFLECHNNLLCHDYPFTFYAATLFRLLQHTCRKIRNFITHT